MIFYYLHNMHTLAYFENNLINNIFMNLGKIFLQLIEDKNKVYTTLYCICLICMFDEYLCRHICIMVYELLIKYL